MNNILIRQAEPKDVGAILELIKELARFEKAADQVVVTLAEIQKDFEAGIFEAKVAEKNGQVVGMTLYYMTYSTWKGRMLYLEDFVIAPSHRRQGIGQLLFGATVQTAKDWGCRIMKWQVLDWNDPAIAFYEKNQAIMETDWNNCKILF